MTPKLPPEVPTAVPPRKSNFWWVVIAVAAVLLIAIFNARQAYKVFHALQQAGVFDQGARAKGSSCAYHPHTGHGNKRLLDVRVVDTDGRPVDHAEVILKKEAEEFWSANWTTLDGGTGTVMSFSVFYPDTRAYEGPFDVAVRAPGFAPSFTTVTLPSAVPVEITMTTGRLVRVHLRTEAPRPIPTTLRPSVILEGYEKVWRSETTMLKKNTASLSTTMGPDTLVVAGADGDNTYSLHLPQNTTSFRVLVNEPDFLQNFYTGPLSADSPEPIDITLPAAAQLELAIEADSNAIRAAELRGLTADIVSESAQAQIGMAWIEPAGPATITNYLAPGTYHVRGSPVGSSPTAARDQVQFTGNGTIELAAGAVEKHTLRLTVIDKNQMHGDGRAVLLFVNRDGTPAQGLAWSITYSDNEIQSFAVGTGKVPADGRVVLDHLRDNGREETYFVTLEDEHVASFFFRGTNRLVEKTITRAPATGDSAPPLTLQKMTDGTSVDTASFAGRIVYIDFWATWCGPCQGAMAHLNEVAARRGADWKDRVVLAAISIDDDLETLAHHVAKKKWEAPLHLWTPGGWNGKAAQLYGIHSVPTALLIDPSGTILWRGNPGDPDFDLEARIEAALAAKPAPAN